MNRLNSMINIMEVLNIYNPLEGTFLYAELSALSEGLNIVSQMIDELEFESFIDTSESYGLELREKMSGPVRMNSSTESRRTMLKYRTAVTANDFTRKSMADAVVCCGMRASIVEYPKQDKLYINCIETLDDSLTQEQIKDAAIEFMPLHLDLDFDFRNFCWESLDSKSISFSELDSREMTWNQIDIYEEE